MTRRFIAVWLGLTLLSGCVRATKPEAAQPVSLTAQASELQRAGMQALNGGDTARAQQYLAASLELGSNADQVLPYLLLACVKERQYHAAVNYGETYRGDLTLRVLEVDLLLGSIYLGLEQYSLARQAFEKALQRNPQHALAHALLGNLLKVEFQEHEAAAAHYRAYLAQEPEGSYALAARQGLLLEVSVQNLPAQSAPRARGPTRMPRGAKGPK